MSLVVRRRTVLTNAQRLRRNRLAREARARRTGRPVGRARPTNGRRRALVVRRPRRRRRPVNGRFKGRMLRGFIPGTRRRRRARVGRPRRRARALVVRGRRQLTRAQKNRRNLLARRRRARLTGRPVGRARPRRRRARALVVRRPRRRRPVNGRFKGRILKSFIPGTRRRRRARVGRRRAPRRRAPRRRALPRLGRAALARRFPLPPPLPPGASATMIALREDKLRLRRNRMARERARARGGRRPARARRPGGAPGFAGFVPRQLPPFRERPGFFARMFGEPDLPAVEPEMIVPFPEVVEEEEMIFEMPPPPPVGREPFGLRQEMGRRQVEAATIRDMKRSIEVIAKRLETEQNPERRRFFQERIGALERSLSGKE